MCEVLSKCLKRFSSYRAENVCDGKKSKGNNLKNTQARVMVLVHDSLLYKCVIFFFKYLGRFSSDKVDMICDWN